MGAIQDEIEERYDAEQRQIERNVRYFAAEAALDDLRKLRAWRPDKGWTTREVGIEDLLDQAEVRIKAQLWDNRSKL